MADLMTPLPEIHLSSLSYSMAQWLPRGGEEDFIDLDAPYQRGSVWTTDQRRALIKSLYMGLPIGSVIVSRLPYDRVKCRRVVDGKQRILAVRAFAADEFTVPRWWFRSGDVSETCTDTDVSWSDLSDRCRRHFEMRATMPALEFDPTSEWLGRDPVTDQARWRARSEEEMIQAEAEVFMLVNGGGTPQTDDDMARAAEIAGR